MATYKEFFKELYEEAFYYALTKHRHTTLTDFILHILYNSDKYDMSVYYLADWHSRLNIDTDFDIITVKSNSQLLELHKRTNQERR